MTPLDWIILIIYIVVIVLMSSVIGRKQRNQEDYYLGGRRVPPWQVGSSMVANQVSAISLIGAPAFIAVRNNGGLKWLQYELAVPLAMIAIMTVLVPMLRSGGGITIYQYLELRFGTAVRLCLSFIFLVSRSMATGVALLATSYVTSVCVDLPIDETILIIGTISLLYTALGGIMADIYSDIIQLVVLWGSSLALIGILVVRLETPLVFPELSANRLAVFHWTSTGIGDGNTFGFWPMIMGGFFLYISYYGCDQSQAQRLLATKNRRGARKALVINGIMRFPLVLTYCVVGVLLIPFIAENPRFAESIRNVSPDYVMPYFFRDYVPPGVLGVIVAGIFAASMSSLDSAINSLSAATYNDFLIRIFPSLDKKRDSLKILISRCITVFWGGFATACAVYMAEGAETVIELVNKIGSAFYGPVAGVFFLGFYSKKAGQKSAILGLAAGVSLNIVLWLFFESKVSWMWWNLTGFFVTLLGGLLLSAAAGNRSVVPPVQGVKDESETSRGGPRKYWKLLLAWFFVIVIISLIIDYAAGGL